MAKNDVWPKGSSCGASRRALPGTSPEGGLQPACHAIRNKKDKTEKEKEGTGKDKSNKIQVKIKFIWSLQDFLSRK